VQCAKSDAIFVSRLSGAYHVIVELDIWWGNGSRVDYVDRFSSISTMDMQLLGHYWLAKNIYKVLMMKVGPIAPTDSTCRT
jgi:hypothetical protein